ncbi:unnamed protein product [Orchesella dallaii]|uniref:Uncharacterized protein n=1 Tax=Orchesella dallaii TaxID=48710 RepID=A0ABP1SA36_9HEXA
MLPDVTNMPPTTDKASRKKLRELQEDGTRVLYVNTNEVQIVRVVAKRRKLLCPSGDELLEVRHGIKRSNITIVTITFAWTINTDDKQPSRMMNQESHIGVVYIKGATAYYFDSHIIRGAEIKRHYEYQGLKIHLPRILEKLNPLPEIRRRFWRLRGDCPITLEGPCRIADLGRWDPLRDESWMDYSRNLTAFLDFVNMVIRRI